MLHIRWTKGRVDVEGSHSDLADLHRALRAFAAAKQEQKIELDADATIDPAPYEKALKRLTVEKSQGLLVAQVLSDALYVSGKPNFIALLADAVPHAQEQTRSSGHYHAHFDQASNPGVVHERSAEIVFTVSK